MKKVLFLLTMLLMVVTTYAEKTVDKIEQPVSVVTQGDSVLSTLPATEKLTMLKVYSDVKSGLSGLASGLKTTAEHVYVVLVKQQLVYAITYTLLDLALVWLTAFLWCKFSKNYKRTQTENDDWYNDNMEEHFGLVGILVFACILSLISTIALFFNLDVIITGYINPEYGAIKDIINFIR